MGGARRPPPLLEEPRFGKGRTLEGGTRVSLSPSTYLRLMVPSAKTPSTTAVYHRPWSFQFPSTVSMTPKSRGGSWGRGDGLRRRFSGFLSAGGLGDERLSSSDGRLRGGAAASCGGLGDDRWLSSECSRVCGCWGSASASGAAASGGTSKRDVRGGGGAAAAAASSRAAISVVATSCAAPMIFDRFSRGMFCHWSLVKPSFTFLNSVRVSSRIACSRGGASARLVVGAVSFVGWLRRCPPSFA